jgi:hypothetical protein
MIATALVVVGCTGALSTLAPSDSPSQRPAASALAGGEGLPIDSTLQAISVSKATGDDATAVQMCNYTTDTSSVVGMARVPSGHDVGKYAPVTGHEPELQTDAAVWVAVIKGTVQLRNGSVAVDPTCVFVGGQRYLYITGDLIVGGVKITPMPAMTTTLGLPALLP